MTTRFYPNEFTRRDIVARSLMRGDRRHPQRPLTSILGQGALGLTRVDEEAIAKPFDPKDEDIRDQDRLPSALDMADRLIAQHLLSAHDPRPLTGSESF